MENEKGEIEFLCRLCANKNDKVISIYSPEGIANDLANKINSYLPITVADCDVLPLHCCWGCASTLLAWHELVVATVEADKRLRLLDLDREKQVEIEGNSQDVAEDDNNSVGSNEADTTAASLTAYNESEESTSPQPCVTKKRSKKTETIAASEKPNDDQEDDKTGVKLEEGDDLTDWIIKTEDGVTFETEIITDLKEEESKDAVQKQTKKERKRQTKLDQEKVEAAKMVVDGRVYYNCSICGKSLHSPYTFIWHMRIHTGERPFVCDLCGKQFRVSQGLVRHLKETHEGIKNFKCDLCGRMFATRRNVVEHRRIHTNERPYICDLCGKSFKQKASLFVHNRSHTDTFPFKCSYCSQGFRTKPPLMIHITRHTGEKPYPCDVCGRCFRIKYELKRHRLIHSDEKPFVCLECGLAFRQKRYLRNHIRINHGAMPDEGVSSSLDAKETSFNTKTNYFANEDNNDGKLEIESTELHTKFKSERCFVQEKTASKTDVKRTVFCDICNLGYTRRNDMVKHRKNKHPEAGELKPKQLLVNTFKEKRPRRRKTEIVADHYCDVCNKGFTRQFDMKKHRALKHPDAPRLEEKVAKNLDLLEKCKVPGNDGQNYYKCAECAKIFRQSYNFLRHQTIHTGIRPFFCHICGKSFRVSGGLQRHINEHHYGVKKYTCDVCGKRFAAKATRDDHLNIHTNTRPFVCDMCGKAFKQKASLHIHKLFHTNVYRYSCNVCAKKFRRANELKVHGYLHSGHKPHKCEICGAMFRLGQDLKRHGKVHAQKYLRSRVKEHEGEINDYVL